MGKRILLIDDEKAIVEILKVKLETNGFKVLLASDGPTGLEAARRERPDVVLLDIMLPKLDGYHVCKMLKVDQRYKNIKVVFLSSKTAPESIALAKASGGDGYLTKDTLGSKIVQLMNEMTGAPS